jgi:hypothetical protein
LISRPHNGDHKCLLSSFIRSLDLSFWVHLLEFLDFFLRSFYLTYSSFFVYSLVFNFCLAFGVPILLILVLIIFILSRSLIQSSYDLSLFLRSFILFKQNSSENLSAGLDPLEVKHHQPLQPPFLKDLVPILYANEYMLRL